MIKSEPVGLIVSQCLFGYGDGHRLLASSINLTPEIEHFLLEISDLDPNASISEDGYLTGLPLPSLRTYVLMRTWHAPEMTRPGCVWTHAIFIKNADMARVEDFAVIGRYLERPEEIGEYSNYNRDLILPVPVPGITRQGLESSACLKAVQAMYSERADGILALSFQEAEPIIFALWTQQWPRLRRSLSFRTTYDGGGHGAGNKLVFDLRLGPPSFLQKVASDLVAVPHWQSVVANDLGGPSVSGLRRFLWRYGSDIRSGGRRLRFLAQLFLKSGADVSTEDMFTLLDSVSSELPEPSDGLLLKKDLLAMGKSTYSMLPALDPLHLMSYLANEPGASAFPPLPDTSFSLISELWHDRVEEILVLAEQAIVSNSVIGDRLLEQLALLADPVDFLRTSGHVPTVRSRLVELRPMLLDSPYLAKIQDADLVELLHSLPNDAALITSVIRWLLPVYNSEVASFIRCTFPDTLQRTVRAVVVERGASYGIAPVWISATRISSADELIRAVQDATGSAADVAACVLLTNFNLNLAKQIPIEIWTSAVLLSMDDLKGELRFNYLAFLFALALDKPIKGSEPLFEYSFEEIHEAAMHSRLPHNSFDNIASRLPVLSFWQQWDTCLRLRLAVVKAYQSQGLDRLSFSRLARNSELANMLRELSVSKIKPGRWF